MPKNKHFTIDEVDSFYVLENDRFIVSFVVGTRDAKTPEEALARALTLIQDDESSDTVWYCCDRQTGTITAYRQEEFGPDN